MEYEIVTLEETTVVGLTARTNNLAPDMTQIIGGLWTDFFGKGIYQAIPDKTDGKTIGLYSEYAGDAQCDYSITVCCRVNQAGDLPQGAVVKQIPAGTYAKFIVRGDLHKAVADFWQELWTMDLKRTFTADYEEYQNSDEEHAEIHMYIAVDRQ